MLDLRKTYGVVIASAVTILLACNTETNPGENQKKTVFRKQDRLDLAMEQEFKMTQDPALGYVPYERIADAKSYLKVLEGNRQARTSALTWEERGPNNIAGRVRAIMIDANDATGNTIFAASVSGGIWKATNFKSTPVWTPVFETMGNLAVCALAQDPSNPNIIYAGTGEGYFNNDAVRGNGIWKSIDGGGTWNKLAATDSTVSSNFQYIQDLAVNSNGVVFASARSGRYCNNGGVLRSSDGGTTWSRVLGNFTQGSTTCDSAFNYRGGDLEIGSNGDVYATTGFQGGTSNNLRGRIYRSSFATHGTDVGAVNNWTEITPSGNWQRIEMAVAPSAPGTLYALMELQTEGIGGLRKSSDFGATWQSMPFPNWCSQGSFSNDFTNGQAWFDLIAAVDPNDANTVIIGGIDLFKSTNAGGTWNQLTQWTPAGCGLPSTIHADQHNVVFYPGSSTELLATNDGGVYYSSTGGSSFATYANGNSTFSSKNIGFNVTQFYGCDFHPTNSNYFLAGAQDNGTQRFVNAGVNSTTPVSGGDGGFCHIDQTDGNIQITSYVYNNYFYSRNGGASFSRLDLNEEGLFINPTDYDDINDIMYTSDVAGKIGVIKFAGAGVPAYTAVTLSQLGSRQISAVKVDPTDPVGGTVWIAGYGNSVPMILKVSNAMNTPTVIQSAFIPGLPSGAYISSIDVDLTNHNRLLLTVSNFGVTSVYLSTNSGVNWSSIEGNLPDMPVRWGVFAGPSAQLNGTTGAIGGILLATELGVWSTSMVNGTSTQWAPNNSGFPNVRTDMLKYKYSDGTVVAASHGRGLFTTTIPGGAIVVTSVPDNNITKDFIRYISANDRALTIVAGNLTTTRNMDLQIFDMQGSLVYRSTNRYQNTAVNLGRFSKGAYIIKITGDKKETFVGQFVKK